MTSPLGHSLGAYIAAGKYAHNSKTKGISRELVAGLALIIFSSNAPDLDFLVGMVMGDFNAYHHRASHSLFAMFLFSLIVWLVARRFRLRALTLAFMSALAFGSHLVLDLLTQDSAAPYGMQLLWPFSQQFYIAPHSVFLRIEHGAMGATTIEALSGIFSMHNLIAVGLELAIFGPLALIMFWRRQHH